MKMKAKDLKPGMYIVIEYGDYGNFVTFEVDAVMQKETKIRVSCHKDRIEDHFLFSPDEEVECKGA